MRLLAVLAFSLGLALSGSALAVNIEWVLVGNPGNPADTPSSNCFRVTANCGSVAYSYYIAKYETTNAQYAEFLNAKAASDPLGLYNTGNQSDIGNQITRSGSSGSYSYSVEPDLADKPVVSVDFHDAMRFANWLNNGQGSADTETGAYTLIGGVAYPDNAATVTRNSGAITFLPNENEWYKAAFYSPGGVYFDYPAGTDTQTVCADPGATANTANCGRIPNGVPNIGRYTPILTDVGSYTGSASPYGTFDQGGNVAEWNEQIVRPEYGSDLRSIRGGGWSGPASYLAASDWSYTPTWNYGNGIGFRVASLVPEPGTGLLVLTGLLGLAMRRRSAR